MYVVFLAVSVLLVILLSASMINPGRTKDGRQFKRKDLAIGLGFFVAIFVVLTVITAPHDSAVLQASNASGRQQPENVDNQSSVNSTTDQQANPAETTPTQATVDKAQAVSYLNDGIDYYVELFQQAQQALGSTRYADACAGLAALDDSNSAASVWTGFSSKFASSDYSSAVTTAYNQASDLYTAAGVDTPSAVGDWNYDINQAYSDIGLWVGDATGWQISSVTTAQLTGDTQAFQRDIASAKADVAKL